MPPKPRNTRKAPTSSVLRLDRKENVDAIEAMVTDREPLFSIAGVEYTIPKRVPAAWTIKVTELALKVNDATAVEYALQKMLGDDGYRALSDCETLTLTDFEVIRDVILKRVIPQGPKAS